MKLISYYHNNTEETGIVLGDYVASIEMLNEVFKWNYPVHLDEMFHTDQFFDFKQKIMKLNPSVSQLDDYNLNLLKELKIAPLYKHPSKIWGIGLNYKDHADDLDEITPSSIPASFMKADTTIIGLGDTIYLPSLAEKTTGEAELGVIIGKRCKNVPRDQWIEVVAGFTCIIDMTAESILRKNPRYLTVSKNFDTFFSFGPVLITPEEIPDLFSLNVATVLNGNTFAENRIKNMSFPPDFLVSWHSEIMTFRAGDIISTGTPRATPLKQGDLIGCRIDAIPFLWNPVEKE